MDHNHNDGDMSIIEQDEAAFTGFAEDELSSDDIEALAELSIAVDENDFDATSDVAFEDEAFTGAAGFSGLMKKINAAKINHLRRSRSKQAPAIARQTLNEIAVKAPQVAKRFQSVAAVKQMAKKELVKIPGMQMATSQFGPVVGLNTEVTLSPVAGDLHGDRVLENIKRAFAKSPGTSVSQTSFAAAGSATDLLLNATDTSTVYAPIVIMRISVPFDNGVAGATFGVKFASDTTAATVEGGTTTIQTDLFEVALPGPGSVAVFAMVPYVLVAGKPHPVIADTGASGATSGRLKISVTGLPAGTYVKALVPGADSRELDSLIKYGLSGRGFID